MARFARNPDCFAETENRMAESIRVKERETFELRLTGHATAGYLWKVSIPPEHADLVALAKPPSWGPNPTRTGGSAVQSFVFHALKPGSLTLICQLQRGFGKDRVHEERVYDVLIEAAGDDGDGE
jgi:predicted secreted protein